MLNDDIREFANTIIEDLEKEYDHLISPSKDMLVRQIITVFREDLTKNNTIDKSSRDIIITTTKGRTSINLQVEIGKRIKDYYHSALAGVETFLLGKTINFRVNNHRVDRIMGSDMRVCKHFLGLPDSIESSIRNLVTTQENAQFTQDNTSFYTNLLELHDKLKGANKSENFYDIAQEIFDYVNSNTPSGNISNILSLMDDINILIMNQNLTESLTEEDKFDFITSPQFCEILSEISVNDDKDFESVDDIINALEDHTEIFRNGVPKSIRNILELYGFDNLYNLIWNPDLESSLVLDDNSNDIINQYSLSAIVNQLSQKRLEISESRNSERLNILEIYDFLFGNTAYFDELSSQTNERRETSVEIPNFAKILQKSIAAKNVFSALSSGKGLHFYNLPNKGPNFSLIEMGQNIQLKKVSENGDHSTDWKLDSLRAGTREDSSMRTSTERSIAIESIESASRGRSR